VARFALFRQKKIGALTSAAPLHMAEAVGQCGGRSAATASMNENNRVKFDDYADNYEQLHAANVSVTGEETGYFSEYKVDCLKRAGVDPSAPLLDFGCGIGNVTEKLVASFSDVHGYEPSALCAERARARVPRARIYDQLEAVPKGAFQTAVLSTVLHHVPPAERHSVVSEVRARLAPGGRLFIFEHNPFNPLVRRAVATCPFDDDAILLWPREQKRLLRETGFEDVRLDYIVFFPRALAFLRPLEPKLSWLFLGAQTMTVGRNPER
jgi:SAM-dependent methyltransferase